jgi:hypothetical protein
MPLATRICAVAREPVGASQNRLIFNVEFRVGGAAKRAPPAIPKELLRFARAADQPTSDARSDQTHAAGINLS